MRLLNLFLITLLCIAVPLQGVAGILATKIPCPAEAMAVKSVDTGKDHSCCNDADTVVKTGKVCKSEQSCQPVWQDLPIQAENPLPIAIGIRIALFSQPLTLPTLPSATWRPPNAL
jgi:hypothetical protein